MIKSPAMSRKVEFEIADYLAAFSDRTRLRLINLMSGGEICVCFFVAALEEPQPKISRHLAYLRRAGLVEARREGKWMHYRLADPPCDEAGNLMRCILEGLKSDAAMRRDLLRLSEVCCAPQPPVQLIGAPKPPAFSV